MTGGDCILFAGHISRQGYGRKWSPETGRVEQAHRRALAQRIGWPAVLAGGEVRHLCGVRACVNVDHLALGSRVDNMADAKIHGTWAHGECHGKAKLTEAVVLECRRRAQAGESQRALAREFNISQGAMWEAIVGLTWRHL